MLTGQLNEKKYRFIKEVQWKKKWQRNYRIRISLHCSPLLSNVIRRCPSMASHVVRNRQPEVTGLP